MHKPLAKNVMKLRLHLRNCNTCLKVISSQCWLISGFEIWGGPKAYILKPGGAVAPPSPPGFSAYATVTLTVSLVGLVVSYHILLPPPQKKNKNKKKQPNKTTTTKNLALCSSLKHIQSVKMNDRPSQLPSQ